MSDTITSIVSWFSSNTIYTILMAAIVIPLISRLFLVIFGKPLVGWRRNVGFWLLVAVTVVISFSVLKHVFNVGVEERPRLKGTIEVINFATVHLGDKEQLCALPVVSIQNTGAPSFARTFSMLARLPSGIIKQGERRAFPAAISLPFPEGQEVVTPEQALDARALQPIPKGGVVTGRELFVFPDFTQDQLKNTIGTVFELTFYDAWDTPITASVQVEGLTPLLLQIPGLNQFVMPSQPPQTDNSNSSNSNASGKATSNANHK